MSVLADFIPNNVTDLLDIVNVIARVIDVGDSSIHVPSLLGDEPIVELSGLLSRNSLMIPVSPAVLSSPENVSVVGERLMPMIQTVYQQQLH